MYVSGICCQLEDYMPPTTYWGNQKQLLIIGFGQVIRNNNDGEAGVVFFGCEFNGHMEPKVMFFFLLW